MHDFLLDPNHLACDTIGHETEESKMWKVYHSNQYLGTVRGVGWFDWQEGYTLAFGKFGRAFDPDKPHGGFTIVPKF